MSHNGKIKLVECGTELKERSYVEKGLTNKDQLSKM